MVGFPVVFFSFLCGELAKAYLMLFEYLGLPCCKFDVSMDLKLDRYL